MKSYCLSSESLFKKCHLDTKRAIPLQKICLWYTSRNGLIDERFRRRAASPYSRAQCSISICDLDHLLTYGCVGSMWLLHRRLGVVAEEFSRVRSQKYVTYARMVHDTSSRVVRVVLEFPTGAY